MQKAFIRAVWVYGGAIATIAAGVGLFWGTTPALAIAAGGLWNLLNITCLIRFLLVLTEQEPGSKRSKPASLRLALWFLVKFPLLYGAAFLLLWKLNISALGFAVGFSVVLLIAVFAGWMQASQSQGVAAHGA